MFKVPAYSQFLDVKDKNWKNRACGIASLKMVLKYWGIKKGADDLIKLGLRKNAYISGVGWTHKGLVLIAKASGLYGKNYDWAKDAPKNALKNLLAELKKYPVIVSIYKNFNPVKSGHLVVLTGRNGNYIFFNDPDSKTRKEIRKKVSVEKFLKGWKGRVVVFHP